MANISDTKQTDDLENDRKLCNDGFADMSINEKQSLNDEVEEKNSASHDKIVFDDAQLLDLEKQMTSEELDVNEI